MRYRLISNGWLTRLSHTAAKGLSILSIMGSSLAISQSYILPGDFQLQTSETYDTGQIDNIRHVEYSQDREDDTVRLSEPNHPSGLGVYQISKGEKKNLKGILEFYIIPENSDIDIKGISLSTDHKFTVTDESDYSEHMDHQCSDEQECSKGALQANFEDRYRIYSNALDSTLVSPDQAVRKIVIPNIGPEDFDSLHPTIKVGGSTCTMGAPDFTSRCQDLRAVIVRYVPKNSEGFYQLTIHLLATHAITSSEGKLKIAGALMSEQIKPVWMAVLGTLFPYRPDRDTRLPTYPVHTRIPEKGIAREILMEMFTEIADREKQVWKKGTCSGSIYCGDEDFYGEQNQVFSLFSANNALQADMHPGARKFEAETVAMTLQMLGGDNLQVTDSDTGAVTDKGAGFITSGGTISNMSAMMTYEKLGRATGIERPAIIASRGIHTSVNKAAYTYNFDLIEVAPDPHTLKMDVAEIKRQIEQNPNIVAVAASTPDYALGVIDPIEELSDMVMEFKEQGRTIWFHVDACMGGFILPFAYEFIDALNDEACQELEAMKKKAGQPFNPDQCHRMSLPKPPYNYPGVTSVSADLHKFGKTIKGLSVITFRNRALIKPQYFSHPDWTGGASITHGPNGSRSQGLLAVGYYTLLRTGHEEYVRNARNILQTAHRFQNIIRMHPELEILGKPSMVFAFTSSNPEQLNVMHIADIMSKSSPSWRYNAIQHPKGLHFCITGPQLFNIKTDDHFSPDSLVSDPLIPEYLYQDFSDATKLFSRDLMLAIPLAEQLKLSGKPALTGSMYGMGAAGIPIEDITVADTILQAGKHITLRTEENGLEPLLNMGRQIVNEHIHQKLQIPAY